MESTVTPSPVGVGGFGRPAATCADPVGKKRKMRAFVSKGRAAIRNIHQHFDALSRATVRSRSETLREAFGTKLHRVLNVSHASSSPQSPETALGDLRELLRELQNAPRKLPEASGNPLRDPLGLLQRAQGAATPEFAASLQRNPHSRWHVCPHPRPPAPLPVTTL